MLAAHSLLQSVFLLLVHLHHDFILLLQDLQLVLHVALLALERGNGVLQLLVLFCCRKHKEDVRKTHFLHPLLNFSLPISQITFQRLSALLFAEQLGHEAVALLLHHRQGGLNLKRGVEGLGLVHTDCVNVN